MQWDTRCSQTETNGILVPGFSGIAAPYWKSGFETIFHQLDGATHNEIIRAGMESIGFLVNDILNTMNMNLTDKMVPASGGGAKKPLLQFISDITGKSIGHSSMKDRTAYGVYKILSGNEFQEDKFESDHILRPKMDGNSKRVKINQWHSALKSAEIL
jgi:glycerol kinase